MDVTEAVIIEIREGLLVKEITQKDLAKKIGRSAPWISKLMHGDTVHLGDRDAANIESALGIRFRGRGEASSLAKRIDNAITASPEIAPILAELVRITQIFYKTEQQKRCIGQDLRKLCESESDPVRIYDCAESLIRGKYDRDREAEIDT